MKFKNIYKFGVSLGLYLSAQVFGAKFSELTDVQKHIHALLYHIAEKERENNKKNYFSTALEITTKDYQSHIFLLRSSTANISFTSGDVLNNTTIVNARKQTHAKLCGENQCKAPDIRIQSCILCKDSINGSIGPCEKPTCFFPRKGLVDSEFACIDFLEDEDKQKEIIEHIASTIGKGQKINSICLHGFTTRDTCLACFKHLSLYCQKANSTQNNIFWTALRRKLKTSKKKVLVNFYISSKFYYNSKETFSKDYDTWQKEEKRYSDIELDNLLEKLNAEQIRLADVQTARIKANGINMLILRKDSESKELKKGDESIMLNDEFETFYDTNKDKIEKEYTDLKDKTVSIIDITKDCQPENSSQEKKIEGK